MPTRVTNQNGSFISGLVDDFTGEDARYAKVTTWVDGSPMSDVHCDGMLYRKAGTEYFRRVGTTRVNVLSLGLKNDGVFRNELLLAEKMEQLPAFTEYYFPAGEYLFGPLPAEYNNLSNVPVAIDWGNSGAHFTGEGESTVFKLLPGCVGMQLNGGLVKGVPRLRYFNVEGPGQDSAPDGRVTNTGPFLSDGYTPNPDAGRQLGDWSRDPNKYQYSGINAWAQVVLEGVNVRSCAGHGVWTQGYLGLRARTRTRHVGGTFINANRFRLDDLGQGSFFAYGTMVELGAAKGFVGGIENNGDISLDVSQNGNVAFPASGHYTIDTYTLGSDLIADNGLIQGNCNFDFNGGCGYYVQGGDGNQWNMIGGSVRENGLEGVLDSSFLGFFAYGTHGSANGKHINKFAVGGVAYNDLLVVGSFRTTDVNASSAWCNCYTEGGNQGPTIAPYGTVVIGGKHEAGVTGGCYFQSGVDANGLKVGDLILSKAKNELILKYGDLGISPLRLRRSGPGNGAWAFGISDADEQHFFPVLSMPLQGATITGTQAQTRTSAEAGIAHYASFLGLIKTQVASTLTTYLGRLAPIDDRVGDYLLVEQGSGSGGAGPRRYRCTAGGATPQYVPDDYGCGASGQRPASLLAQDASWRWFSTDTGAWSTWTGTAWA